MSSKRTKIESSDAEFPEEDAEDSKPLKRARLNKGIDNTSNPGSINPYTKSLYFFEVNPMAVLVVEGTAFRVHRHSLAEASPFFADMFSLTPRESLSRNETFQGYPVIHFQDNKEDFENFLFIFHERTLGWWLADCRANLD
ncbi:hypothetical protein M422DRAFT_246317 [Sphaerobolus stellatus SS14]|nr:hypothetical protein M422DRAFT_246317 [Sphaerobolus stellatus SS14]